MKRLCVLWLLLCTTAVADDRKDETEADQRNDCILVTSRLYMQALGEEYVYVESGTRRYLLTARRRCPGLDQGYNMQFKGKRRQVCSTHRPSIEYYDQHIEMPACRIETIREVENWQEAQALVLEREQARVKERNEEKARKKALERERQKAREQERS